MLIGGKEVSIHQPYEAIQHGIGLLPEDRKAKGLLLDKSVLANITLSSLRKYCKLGVINREKEKRDRRGIYQKPTDKDTEYRTTGTIPVRR